MVFMAKSMFGLLNVVKVLLELFLSSFACFFSNPHHRPRREKEEGSTFTQQIGDSLLPRNKHVIKCLPREF